MAFNLNRFGIASQKSISEPPKPQKIGWKYCSGPVCLSLAPVLIKNGEVCIRYDYCFRCGSKKRIL